MKLWEHQEKAIQDFLNHPSKSYLMQFETGLGKTVIAEEIIKKYNAENKKVIFFTHKLELRDQTFNRFQKGGIDCGLIASGKTFEANKLCYVAMVQTASARLDKEDLGVNAGSISKDILGDIDLVIFDETHRIDADTWTELQTQLYKDHKNIRCLGLSATPIGSNGGGLYKNFEHLEQGMYLHEAIKKGLLCKYKLFAPSENLDYGIEHKGLKIKDNHIQDAKSDFTPSEIKKIDATFDRLRVYGNAVTEWEKLAKNKKTLVFALSVNAAVKIAKEFNEKGYDFRVFHSKMDSNDRIKWLEQFKNSEYLGIVNVGIFVEGTDCPDIECIVDVAPTRQLRVQRQKLGRGFRISKNKEYLTIIDLANNSFFHGMPDDEIKYTLQGFQIPNRKSSGGRAIHPAYIKCSCCSLIFRKKEPVCPACGTEYNNGEVPEELPREIIERLKNEKQKRVGERMAKQKQQEHYKGLWKNLEKHNVNKLNKKGLRYSVLCYNDETLLFVKQTLWDLMQDVLQEVIKTYQWQDMELMLNDTLNIFYNFQFANLVHEYYLGNVSKDAFKMCFRIILLDCVGAWINGNGHDRLTKQSLLANSSFE
jgi:superfamily II DNA or RNA helicase